MKIAAELKKKTVLVLRQTRSKHIQLHLDFPGARPEGKSWVKILLEIIL